MAGPTATLSRMEEQRLLSAALVNDPEAWTTFCKIYTKIISLCVNRALARFSAPASPQDREDLVAEVWLLLLSNDYHRLRSFDASRGTRLSTWIGSITFNHTIDFLRKHRRQCYWDDMPCADSIMATDTTPWTILQQREANHLVRRAISSLKTDEQRFLNSWLAEDTSPVDMAEDLGISVATVYSRRFKVREKISRFVSSFTPHTEPRPIAA